MYWSEKWINSHKNFQLHYFPSPSSKLFRIGYATEGSLISMQLSTNTVGTLWKVVLIRLGKLDECPSMQVNIRDVHPG